MSAFNFAIRRAVILAMLASAGIMAGGKAFADREETAMLDDVEWRVAEIAGAPLAEGQPTTITFGADGAFFGKACNNFRGAYTTDGHTLTLSRVASTMMACPEPLMAQERTLFDALERVTSWRIAEDGALVLDDADGVAAIVARR